jgi:hypothetical protein
MFGRPVSRNRSDDPMDGSGIALLMQQSAQQTAQLTEVTRQQAQIVTDVATIKTMMETSAATVADHEARLRVQEQRPSSTDLEARVRGLERWRYALPISAVAGVGGVIGSLVALFHH